ncbi:MAG: hypothetical protein NZZ41_00140 [Candidatus Dojkabacteria bacterium]|nr:hypothetical protein [Candidatus Dojkabacteria bacterium]
MKNRNFGFFSEAIISNVDKNRLKTFIISELLYYNSMIDIFQNRNRLFPEIMAKTSQNILKTLYHVILKGKTLSEFESLKDEKEEVVKIHKIVLDDQNYKKCYRMIFEKALNPNIVICNDTKANMVKELFAFFVNQATILSDENVIKNKNPDISLFKIPPSNLNLVEPTQKRHVQLSKKVVSWKYDPEKDLTLLKTPYTCQDIILNNINLNEKSNDWNLMIIHQEPGKIPVETTPWVINFIKTNEVYYLIKYLDMTHPYYGSAFAINLPKVARK